MSWTKKVKHPSKLLEVGTEVECQVLEVDSKAKRISLGMKQLEPDPWTIFTDKYHPGDRIGGKVRSLTDYGVFVGIEDGVDGMVHKSDISWSLKIGVPSEVFHKGDDVEAIVLSINHDDKKVSLGIKQLHDDPWPGIFNELSHGKVTSVTCFAANDTGVYVRVRPGLDGFISLSDLKEITVDGASRAVKAGDTFDAEVAHIDTHERRVLLSMKIGEVAAQPQQAQSQKQPRQKKASGDEPKAGTIGDLIKAKLGSLNVPTPGSDEG
jgi:small subunit ribosomal protein S1